MESGINYLISHANCENCNYVWTDIIEIHYKQLIGKKEYTLPKFLICPECKSEFCKYKKLKMIKIKSKKETLKQSANRILWDNTVMLTENHRGITQSMIDLAKWHEQKMYSEEEVLKLLLQFHKDKPIIVFDASEWFEQFKKKITMAQQTTYEKLDQLLVLCNEIREEILARRVEATNLLEVNENHWLEVLSTHIPDEERVYDIKRDLKRLDDTINNKL